MFWGLGVVVEVDETQIEKRKYNRRDLVDGAWVIGGVERSKKKNGFLVKAEDKSAKKT